MDIRWRIELSGGLRAEREDRIVARFGTQKTASLLGYLAFYRDRSHPREVLIELLWPECEARAGRNRLSQALSSLRRQLEPPGTPAGAVIVASRAVVQLNPGAVTTDMAEFEDRLRAAAQVSSGIEQAQKLAEAVELYRGELLPGCFEEWIFSERERLVQAYLQALHKLTEHFAQCDDLPHALVYARRAVVAEPLGEEVHQELIRILAAAGQPEAALRQYLELERLFQQQLGTAPGAESRALAHKVTPPSLPSPSLSRTAVPPARSAPHQRPLLPASPSRAAGPPAAAPLGPRGTFTFLLAEIERAPTPGEREGGTVNATREAHLALLRSVSGRHGGQWLQSSGDALLVGFARAGDALTAAVAGQRALAAHASPAEVDALRVRMGLHTGDVEWREGQYHGPVLDHVTRLLSASHPGQILLSEVTAGLVRDNLAPGQRVTELGRYSLQADTPPERLFQAHYPDMVLSEFPPPHAAPACEGYLPAALTRFIGREREVTLLQELLLTPDNRLLTLTGPGGSGKTRLALEVARKLGAWGVSEEQAPDRRAGPRWPGAVWFVPLVDLADPHRILDKMMEALRLPRSAGLEPLQQVVTFLSYQPSLLVLDNFEHLVTHGAPLVRLLLERVPGLTCLVTSRQRLNLPGEREWMVLPLPTPEDTDSPEGLMRCESVQLLVDRAQAVKPDFQVTGATASTVAQLCRRLEGIPLAIELAAGRAGVFTPAQMLARLRAGGPQRGPGPVPGAERAARFDLLVSRHRDEDTRHCSLQAAFDWSYQLLSGELQRCFARLSVFRGGWTPEAAATVCDEPLALDYLTELRECSLVQTEEVGVPETTAIRLNEQPYARASEHQGPVIRFRMLQTLREYARGRLTPDECAALEQQHAEYYTGLAEEVNALLDGPDQAIWLERLECEHDNMRAALDWSIQASPATALRLGAALWWFWHVRCYLTEGRQRLAALLELPTATMPTATNARLLHGAGLLALFQGDYTVARTCFDQSMVIRRALGDRRYIGYLSFDKGILAREEGQWEEAQLLFEECLAISHELGDRLGIAIALHKLGSLAHYRGNYEQARAFFEESLSNRREENDLLRIQDATYSLGEVAHCQGDYLLAWSLLQESRGLAESLGQKAQLGRTLNALATVARAQGDAATARALYEQSLAIHRGLGDQQGMGWSLFNLGSVMDGQDEISEGLVLLDESLMIFRKLGYRYGIAHALYHLGILTAVQGDSAAGDGFLAESLEIRRALGDRPGIAACLEQLARVESAQGQAKEAARWLGAAEALRAEMGAPVPLNEQPEQHERAATLRQALGDAAFTAAWDAGRSLSWEQAATEALGEPPIAERVRQMPGRGGRQLLGISDRVPEADLTHAEWERIVPILPASAGSRGRPFEDHRPVINGIFWVLRTGAAWRDLPPRYGSWHTCHDRYLRWRRQGHWDRIMQALNDPPRPGGA